MTRQEDTLPDGAGRARAPAGPRAAAILSGRDWALLLPLLLAGGTVWLTFEAGGYFAGTTAIAVVVTGLALLLWLMLVDRPFAALSAPLAVAVAGLILFAAWALVSQSWSHAPARAVIESDRTLLYALAVALFGLAAASAAVREWVPRLLTLALVAVSAIGLVTRLLPDVWGVDRTLEFERLSYPITYWNAQGMVGALAIVAALHLASSGREHRLVRAAAAASIPIVATAVLFTFSRGAIVVIPIGVIVYLALARPPRVVSALLATLPTTAVALVYAYGADAVVEARHPTAALIAQGKDVALVVAGCALAAGLLSLALARLDDRLGRIAWRPSRPQAWGAGAALLLAVVAVGLAVDLPERIGDRIDELDQVQFVEQTGDSRQRLTNFGDNGRVDQWQVALEAFSRDPLAGAGAGTYPLLWSQYRKTEQSVTDGHSLYLETMAEMGLIGLALLVVVIGSLLVGTLMRRRSDRALGSVAFALTLMWALRAGVDWDWEMPALTLPVLVFAAVVLYTPGTAMGGAPWPGRLPRLLGGLALLGALITPLAIARSQGELNQAVAEARAGQCGPAISSAIASTDALSIRPEPFQILAVCDLRAGRPDLALAAINAAVRRDPDSWKLHYNRGIVRAYQGLDPRRDLRLARDLNPLSPFLKSAVTRFDTSRSALWRSRARKARVLG